MIKEKTITEIGWNLENSYARLPKSFFSMCNPIPVASPKLVCLNYDLAKDLGLNAKELESKEGIEILAGNRIPEGATPLAQAYAGHQYGHFTMLGDGRAVLLGEQITPKGERFDIQLKGSGETPYSRRGDGRATLGPMLREYIISEAMNALGIPTTRSLAVVATGEEVMRQNPLPGAVLTRVASSHLRFGTFQYVANWGTVEELKILADYAIRRHFTDVKNSENPYLSLLREVMKGQANLVTKWQMVGFIHGVMNTDNMTISGETIDYGPCAFMDNYDPLRVFSSIDTGGRYAYGNQHNIAGWNMARFAETLIPLLHPNQEEAIKMAESAILDFAEIYRNNWIKSMRSKLGIFNEEVDDISIIQEIFDMMHKYSADYTNTFRALTLDKAEESVLFGMPEFSEWYDKWRARLDRQEQSKELSYEMMKKSNPAVIPRNHRVEAALEAAVKNGDYSVMERLLDALSKPYAYSKEQEEYTKLPEIADPYYRTFCGT